MKKHICGFMCFHFIYSSIFQKKKGKAKFIYTLFKKNLTKTIKPSMYVDTQNSNTIRRAIVFKMQPLHWETSAKLPFQCAVAALTVTVTTFMRKQTEEDPYAHTPALWWWSSCPSQYCGPSFQHPQFPFQSKNENQLVTGLYVRKSSMSKKNQKWAVETILISHFWYEPTLRAWLKPSTMLIHCAVCLENWLAWTWRIFTSRSSLRWFTYAWATLRRHGKRQ